MQDKSFLHHVFYALPLPRLGMLNSFQANLRKHVQNILAEVIIQFDENCLWDLQVYNDNIYEMYH
jgi:hypothetical protein